MQRGNSTEREGGKEGRLSTSFRRCFSTRLVERKRKEEEQKGGGPFTPCYGDNDTPKRREGCKEVKALYNNNDSKKKERERRITLGACTLLLVLGVWSAMKGEEGGRGTEDDRKGKNGEMKRKS